MVERRNGKFPAVRLEYTFDRLLIPKLVQVYEILAPARVRIIGEEQRVKDGGNEDRRDLRPRILRQTEGGEHNIQSDGSIEGIRRRA